MQIVSLVFWKKYEKLQLISVWFGQRVVKMLRSDPTAVIMCWQNLGHPSHIDLTLLFFSLYKTFPQLNCRPLEEPHVSYPGYVDLTMSYLFFSLYKNISSIIVVVVLPDETRIAAKNIMYVLYLNYQMRPEWKPAYHYTMFLYWQRSHVTVQNAEMYKFLHFALIGRID